MAAQRELREEGGYRAERFEFLTSFHPSNAYLDEVAYCYAAWGLTPDPLPADPDELGALAPRNNAKLAAALVRVSEKLPDVVTRDKNRVRGIPRR